ncbi:primary-amine oxidase [Wickerhamomyces ciferrii]|uniref:Amine oxidase n=1 Tax=Wickerhamomyces ciferrii (strain ATCC 14091 / BCRC 22168 / CBS 111 / JCM 3599 / NBRC 0793 / NRRL Y-1031 F-60-10) TaxID=1206466 RepID=K0KML0_WICCF|nr:primary-amine oxidase [Wickerhamomyces ciferrii]CCH42609.1 primary-amine oxidase [Wickerhamomyces ciferrii]
MKFLGVLTLTLSAITLTDAISPRQAKAKSQDQLYTKRSESYIKRDTLCSPSFPKEAVPPKANIWADLDTVETKDVFDLLKNTYPLTPFENATLFDNYLMWIELLRPNKTSATDYLDNNGAVPDRYARASIFFGSEEYTSEEYPNGYWQELQIGPLGKNGTNPEVSELDWLYTKSKVAYEVGYKDPIRFDAVTDFYEREFLSEDLLPVLIDLVGEEIKWFGQDNSTVDCWGTDPLQFNKTTGRVTNWATIFINYQDAEDITPTGLFLNTDITGRNSSEFFIAKWVYNNIAYNSTEDFIKAYESPDFVKLPTIDTSKLNSTDGFVYIGQKGETRELDEKLAPIVVEPQGRRWKVNEEQRYFTWMDWEFYVAWSRDVGLTLYDLKFKGERIAFEIGLQEAIAEYAGDDPFQAHTAYFDRSYGFGNEAFGLIPGFDCPYNAEMFNTTWHSQGSNNYQNNSYCAFEFVEDYGLARHAASEYTGVTKNPTFNLRSITTIGNYDYNFLYKFYLDGTFEVSVRAAGFIQGAYYNPDTGSPFGYRVNEVLSGSFHDHVLNFKADFDIAGTSNKVSTTALKPANFTYPWDPERVYSTKIKERSVVQNETYLNWADAGGVLLIESADQNNTWGNPKAYRAIYGGGDARRIAQNSVTIGKNAEWASHDLIFTKQKDSELQSSHVLNANDLEDPIVDISKYVDGENLDGEDLVCWFNLALHHLPNTNDIPNTIFSTAESGIVFTPFNYFDSEQSRDTLQQMYYEYETSEWDFNGVDVNPQCDIEIEPLAFHDVNYYGVTVGKDTTNIPSP